MTLLGVNVDHVATLRQARKTYEPDPVWAAASAQLGGADLITIHLRKDRRHICDRDLRLMLETVSVPLNLEMSLEEEIVDIAMQARPAMVTIVPERRAEITTEGGLDVRSRLEHVADVIRKFRESGVKVSLFIDPDSGQIDACRETNADMVELHTGCYANSSACEREREMEKITTGAAHARKLDLVVNAGHGLTYCNVTAIVKAIGPHELHIGHSIIARAVFTGLANAVSEMKKIIQNAVFSGV